MGHQPRGLSSQPAVDEHATSALLFALTELNFLSCQLIADKPD